MIIKTKLGNLSVVSKYTHDRIAMWDDKNFNSNKVTVKWNGRQASFWFWGSVTSPILKQEEYDLGNAVYCWLWDADLGSGSFEDFCEHLGYDTDSRKAEKSYKACKKSYTQAIGMFEESFEQMLEAVSEYA